MPEPSLEESLPEALYTRIGWDKTAVLDELQSLRRDYRALRAFKAARGSPVSCASLVWRLQRMASSSFEPSFAHPPPDRGRRSGREGANPEPGRGAGYRLERSRRGRPRSPR